VPLLGNCGPTTEGDGPPADCVMAGEPDPVRVVKARWHFPPLGFNLSRQPHVKHAAMFATLHGEIHFLERVAI
jgi:hypothetical protein